MANSKGGNVEDMQAKIAVNATNIKVIQQELEQLRTDNRNDHLILGEKIDKLTSQVTQLVERGKVERERDKAVLSVRIWLIAIIMSAVTFIITLVTHK